MLALLHHQLFLIGTVALAEQPVRVALLQRMSDVRLSNASTCATTWEAGRCWLADEWKAIAAASLLAVDDFNQRLIALLVESVRLQPSSAQ